MVTSSWVGPTPPDVNTTSSASLNSRTSAAMRSTSSGITEIRRTSTPSARSSRQRKEALASAILPERISLPMRMMPAVFAMRLMVARAPPRAEVGAGPAVDAKMPAECRSHRLRLPSRFRGWALVLGASSGFGEATSLALARAGLDVFGVHLDRRARSPTSSASSARSAPWAARRTSSTSTPPTTTSASRSPRRWSASSASVTPLGHLRVLLHSLAFGTLKLFVADPMKEAVTKAQMDMTLDVMAHSLIYWTQEVVGRGLMGRGRPHLRHDLLRRRPRAALLRAGLRGQGRARVEHPPARRRAGPARHHRQLHPRRRDRHARGREDPQLRRVLEAGGRPQPARPADHHGRRGPRHRRPLRIPTLTGSPAT